MMIFSLVAMIGLDKCCITSACLQWLCHSGERIVARGPLVIALCFILNENILFCSTISYQKVFVFTISVFCFQKLALKLIQPNLV